MKQLILLVLFINQLLAIPPSWYINQNINNESYEIIGYGEGATLDSAKQIAKSDIAKMIQTNISTSISIEKSVKDGEYKSNVSQNINEKTNIALTDLEVVGSRYVDNKYYIAIKYINLPFAKKVKILIGDNILLEKSTNQYLNKTPLMQELKEEFGFYPKVSLSQNNIIINNQTFHLTKKDFVKLFTNIENNLLSLDMKDNYKDGEYYFIKVKSKKSGYLNIFQVYESSETVLLVSNKKVKASDKTIYPNPKEYDGLEAVVSKGQVNTKDLTIVALCKDKKDFSLFDKVDTTINKKSLFFGEILDKIDKCKIVSKTINIKK